MIFVVMPTRFKPSATSIPYVLLVDDNLSGLAARRAVLEELGFKTAGAAGPKEALQIFRNCTFDLVVTDYKMPDMDGVEFIKKLRAENSEIPVVLISGFVDALGLTEKSTGASVVIMKSANEVQHLIRAVNRMLRMQKKPPARARSGSASRKAAAS